jgi:2-methylcitrate dehydratase
VDSITQNISEFARALRFEDIPESSRRIAIEHILDSLGCAIRAENTDGAVIAKRLAAPVTEGSFRGRVIGSSDVVSADMAAFINSAMIRYLDFSDTLVPGGHPSDMLGALIAVAASRGLSGKQLITAFVVGYEVFARFGESAYIRKKGYDQGLTAAIGVSAALGNLLGLSTEVTANAVALSTAACVSLRVTRGGKLSMWKGSSTAEGVREAVFLTAMAEGGMEGPEKPFEGRHGVWEVITQAPFEFRAFPVSQGGEFLTTRASLKYWPVEFNTQIAVWAAKELAAKSPVDEIESVHLGIYWSAWHETGSEPEKWDPQTRETADHSLPYIFARSLVDDGITIESFDRDRYLDPAIRPVMNKITVGEDDAANAKFPGVISMSMRAVLTSGEVVEKVMENAPGHADNRMTEEQITSKFRLLVEPTRGSEAVDGALEFWWNLEAQPSIAPGLDLLSKG